MRRTAPTCAAVYARISHDPSGERLGVQRQEADCLAEAKRRGWSVAQVYVDDDLSAFDPKKARPEYERLLTDIQVGSRDGVMIWRLDRLHRQPRELEEFILACDKHHVALATVTGDVDLSTSQGRLLARAWGAFAAHESEVKGERLARASLDRARRGIVHAPTRPYGYRSGGLSIKLSEASVIQEAARRLLAGDALRAICVDFIQRRIPTTRGTVWHPSVLRGILANPRLAGLSTYRGEVVGKANWKPILTHMQSDKVRALLADPSRRQNDGGRHWYLLKGLVRCGRCGERLFAYPKGGKRRYACVQRPLYKGCGRVSIPADSLEALIMERIYERLDSPALVDALAREHVADPQWRKAKTVLDASERRLAQMARDYAAGSLTRAEWSAARPILVERVDASRSALLRDRAESAVIEFVGKSRVLRGGWDRLAPSRRHVIVAALLEQIVIWPAKTTIPKTVDERLSIWWRGESRPRTPRRARGGIEERRAAGEFDRCSVAGCTEAYRASGYCTMHLKRWSVSGDAGEPGRRRHVRYRGAPCLEKGCDRPAYCLGRCPPHYRLWRTTLSCGTTVRRDGV